MCRAMANGAEAKANAYGLCPSTASKAGGSGSGRVGMEMLGEWACLCALGLPLSVSCWGAVGALQGGC